MKMHSLILILVLLVQPFQTLSFSHVQSQPRMLYKELKRPSKTRLAMSNQFDVSKPVWDFYAFREVRGDALAKYNSLNQSEPLRINLWAIAVLFFLSLPSVLDDTNGVPLSALQVATCFGCALGSVGLFLRECRRRNRQLVRFEKELMALSLPVRLPNSVFSDSQFGPSVIIRNVQKERTMRLLALYGTASELTQALSELKILGRRLNQAETLVVPVSSDNSKLSDWGLSSNDRPSWLGAPGSTEMWREYFISLSDSADTTDTPAEALKFKWFGLSAVGRSFASGRGSQPSWIQLMGQHLRPTAVLDADDESQKDESGVLDQLLAFYCALTEGKVDELKDVFSDVELSDVTDVIRQGGRLDNWELCLEDGNRPAGMKVADADVTLVDRTLAYSTIVEFPALIEGATLLALQQWTRPSENEPWKLAKHQTIPWAEYAAAGTLICDCRGCVSLVRGQRR